MQKMEALETERIKSVQVLLVEHNYTVDTAIQIIFLIMLQME